jgi:hypothetical protein
MPAFDSPRDSGADEYHDRRFAPNRPPVSGIRPAMIHSRIRMRRAEEEGRGGSWMPLYIWIAALAVIAALAQ